VNSKVFIAKAVFSAQTRAETLSKKNGPMRASYSPQNYGSRKGLGWAKNIIYVHFEPSQTQVLAQPILNEIASD
jgi:hypothetical protein